MKITEINEIAKDLKLYEKIDYIGKGFEIFLPRGAKIIEIIQKYIEEKAEKSGFEIVKTPNVSNSEIYKIEDRYKEQKDNYFAIEDNEKEEQNDNSNLNKLVLKPYVSPFHCSIFKSTQHSYKELPLKFLETSNVVIKERDIKGILKTRQYTISTASTFSNKENIQKSIKEDIKFLLEFAKKLGLECNIEVDNWNDEHKEDYIGTINEWDYATNCMKKALNDMQISFKETKNAKMYGPRVKVKYNQYLISDIQIDFEITHRFDLNYKNNQDKNEFPYYINTTIVESYENLLKILIERYNGRFPLWLAPTQIVIIPESEEFEDYSFKVAKNLNKEFKEERNSSEKNIYGIDNSEDEQEFEEKNMIKELRCKVDTFKSSLKLRFDKNVKLKIPYIITIGKKELNNQKIRVYKYKEMLEKNKFENSNSISKLMTEVELIKEVTECQTKY